LFGIEPGSASSLSRQARALAIARAAPYYRVRSRTQAQLKYLISTLSVAQIPIPTTGAQIPIPTTGATMITAAASFLLTPHFPVIPRAARPVSTPKPKSFRCLSFSRPVSSRRDFRAWADDGDADGDGPDDYEIYGDEIDDKNDFDIDYDTGTSLVAADGGDGSIPLVHSSSFVSTQGWESEKIVDYRINEDEFHKICLLDCDFFIRKPPDPDNDVYDFREMYVTPPDTDVYAIPKVLAPMPQKYIRCAQRDYGRYNVTEPPVDALRDPLYKSERQIFKVWAKQMPFSSFCLIQKSSSFPLNSFQYVTMNGVDWVFLKKHYKNRRVRDPDFVLDFEEIYVIDSKTKSITRAKVVEQRDDPTTVIQKEEWNKSREDMEKHLRKLRDFDVSNWF
ncbi:plastid transcriptionally active 6, partial [Striga asiatica]